YHFGLRTRFQLTAEEVRSCAAGRLVATGYMRDSYSDEYLPKEELGEAVLYWALADPIGFLDRKEPEACVCTRPPHTCATVIVCLYFGLPHLCNRVRSSYFELKDRREIGEGTTRLSDWHTLRLPVRPTPPHPVHWGPV